MSSHLASRVIYYERGLAHMPPPDYRPRASVEEIYPETSADQRYCVP